MKNSILYRKLIVSTLATVLLVCGVQGICYSQEVTGDADLSIAKVLSEDQIYAKAIRSVMWIITHDGGQASGVLIDKKRKLAVTNEHVTKNNTSVVVVFPVRDGNGKLISDRSFYVNENNIGVSKSTGLRNRGTRHCRRSQKRLGNSPARRNARNGT